MRKDQIETELEISVRITFDGDDGDFWVDGVTLLFPKIDKEIEVEAMAKDNYGHLNKMFANFVREYGEGWEDELQSQLRG